MTNLKQPFLACLLLALAPACFAQKTTARLLGTCEGCEWMFDDMPAEIGSMSRIAAAPEPGTPLRIHGTIYQSDGKTPAPNVILYVYHTDDNGLYSPAPGQKKAIRHGHLRGWVKTDINGHYELLTIRPAPYPNADNPAHIHPIILEPDGSYYWIDEYLFDDDPLVTSSIRRQQDGRGGSGIIHLTKNQKGMWEGQRNIVLRLNVR